jgi:DNA polymerase-3 subunit beta
MKIITNKAMLLEPLQQVGGIVERRQTLPILANILFNIKNSELTLTATDLEVEMTTILQIDSPGETDLTLPARKLIDICRALPDNADITFDIEGDRVRIHSGPSRFSLGTLPAKDYPAIEPTATTQKFSVGERKLKKLIEKTQFAMAQQDVRYYLNGMLLEIGNGRLRAVATDGHRLATSEIDGDIDQTVELQVIIPRKAVLELGKLLRESSDGEVQIEISSNHVRVKIGKTLFTSKLVDGKFPDYQRVIPTTADKTVVVDRETLRAALQRTSILSNEKYRGIRFQFAPGTLELLAHNPEQEEAKEELGIEYQDEALIIGFNVGYLIEVFNVISLEKVSMHLSDSNSSCLIDGDEETNSRYVIMPMRL